MGSASKGELDWSTKNLAGKSLEFFGPRINFLLFYPCGVLFEVNVFCICSLLIFVRDMR